MGNLHRIVKELSLPGSSVPFPPHSPSGLGGPFQAGGGSEAPAEKEETGRAGLGGGVISSRTGG